MLKVCNPVKGDLGGRGAAHKKTSAISKPLVECVIISNMACKQLNRLEYWHHDLIDWLLAHPEMSGREVAAHFDVSHVWISIVKNSLVFQTEFERRREMISRSVGADIAERATALAHVSLDVMTDRIGRDGRTMPMRELCNVAAMSLKMLGLGVPRGRGASRSPVTVNVGHVDANMLEAAREKIRQHNRAPE